MPRPNMETETDRKAVLARTQGKVRVGAPTKENHAIACVDWSETGPRTRVIVAGWVTFRKTAVKKLVGKQRRDPGAQDPAPAAPGPDRVQRPLCLARVSVWGRLRT